MAPVPAQQQRRRWPRASGVRRGRLSQRILQDEAVDGGPAAITGASCLYAIYDPTRRRCTMARAAHPPPALVLPDDTVHFPDVPAGPPLGLVSPPFEITEFEVPEGSRLVLYADGLIEHRDRDIDDSLTRLRDVLAGTDHTPEETCTAVLDAVLPARPTDDVALLIARTRAPAADDIAEWEAPSDPAAVADTRKRIRRHLTRWGLEEAAFTTELILSEPVTNAPTAGAPAACPPARPSGPNRPSREGEPAVARRDDPEGAFALGGRRGP
ncbi:SpoIIE family protein phosphatase [Streptomyces sp. NPDC001852]|uniref:SpoIIE family protein phosphatase n=1 Tax=Streptomyces sp. NPDC001852 TaxID=3364619 RepID=UPI003674442C